MRARACVCVCVYARARACVCVCKRALKLTGKLHCEIRARPNDQIYTICKNGRLGEYSLKTQFIS